MFYVGLISGAACSGLVLLALVRILREVGTPQLVLEIGSAGLAVVVGLLSFSGRGRLPQSRRQVPSWFTDIAVWGFWVFGFEMGTGLRTYSPTGLPHLVALALVASGCPAPVLVGAIAGFSAGRFAGVWIARSARIRTGRVLAPRGTELTVAALLVIGLVLQ